MHYFKQLVTPPFKEYLSLTANNSKPDFQSDWVPFLGVTLHEIHNIEASFKNGDKKSAAIDAMLLPIIAAISKSKLDTVNVDAAVSLYLQEFKPFDSSEAYKTSQVLEPKEQPQHHDAEVDSSLTSNPVFFYGVPAIAVAAIAATIGFLLYRKHHAGH